VKTHKTSLEVSEPFENVGPHLRITKYTKGYIVGILRPAHTWNLRFAAIDGRANPWLRLLLRDMAKLIRLLGLWHNAPTGQNLPLQAGAAGRGADRSDYDFPIVITAMPINAAQRRAALALVILLFVIGLATVPFAALPGPRINAFIPVLQTVACLVDLVTAALLFSQYLIRPFHATLAIAAGYVFSGLFAFAQTLAFPDAYLPGGLIGDGRNTAAWLFVLWHTAFPVAVLIYALLKDRNAVASQAAG